MKYYLVTFPHVGDRAVKFPYRHHVLLCARSKAEAKKLLPIFDLFSKLQKRNIRFNQLNNRQTRPRIISWCRDAVITQTK